MKDKHSQPWLGLSSYEERHSHIFHGRTVEMEELFGDIVHNIQTVIYGPSGVGKTSILNAGIFVKARSLNYLPVYVQLNHDGKQSYTSQIINRIKTELKKSGGEIEKIVAPVANEDSSLWEFFHSSVFWSSDNYPLIPMVVVDQFEEIFTLTKDKKIVVRFFEELSDLCDNTMPEYIKEYLNSKMERREFPDTVNYRLILSLREDFLARLEEYAVNIPSFRRNRFSLQAINEEQAMEIILKPSDGLVSEDVAIEIIKKVTNNANFKIDGIPEITVEPALLSIFCDELNKKRIANNLTEISLSLLNEFGDNIIRDFYDNKIGLISEKSAIYFEKVLLTGRGFRDSISLRDAISNGVSKTEIDLLVKNRVIRIEERNGEKRVEYTHDILLKEAKRRREERKNNTQKQNIRKSQKNVLYTSGRTPIDNSLAFEDTMGDVFESTLRMIQYKYHSVNQFDQNASFSTLMFDAPEASIITFSFKDEYSKYCPSKDGIFLFSIKFKDKRIQQIRFLDENRTPMCLKYGNYGFDFEYDERGNETSRMIVGLDDKPLKIRDGYAIIKTKFDNNDNPILIQYFDENENPCAHIDGNYGYQSLFDSNGNERRRTFLDSYHLPTTIRFGYSSVSMDYNDLNLISKISYLNEVDEPCMDIWDNHAVCIFYDSNQRIVKQSYYDINNRPTKSKNGYFSIVTSYDERALPNREMYLDEEGNPSPDNYGIYGIAFTIDENYRLPWITYIDKYGNPMSGKNGVCHTEFEYDRLVRVTSIKYFGVNRNPSYNKDADSHWTQFEYDQFGRLVKIRYYGLDGELSFNSDGESIIELNYDEYGRKKTRISFDKKGLPCSGLDGKHVELREYLDNKIIISWYDINNKKIGNKAVVKLDKNDRLISYTEIDENSIPIQSSEGYYTEEIFYDAENRRRQVLFFDNFHNPQADNDGNYGYIFKYCSSGLIIEWHLLGSEGLIHNGLEGFGIIKYKYDEYGNIIECFYYDNNGNPALHKDGFHGYRLRSDEATTNILEYVGIDNKLCNINDGYSIRKIEENEFYNTISYFDKNNNPAINSAIFFHKKKTEITKDEQVELFFGVNDQLINCKDGYAKTIKKSIDNVFLEIDKIEYFDFIGNPVNNEAGMHRIIRKQNSENVLKAYDYTGKCILNNETKLQRMIIIFKWLLFVLLFPFMIIYFGVESIVKFLKSRFKKVQATELERAIVIGDVIEMIEEKYSAAKIFGIKSGDLLLQYNKWDYWDNYRNSQQTINSFELVFSDNQIIIKTLSFARTEDSGQHWKKYSVDFPKGMMGIKFIDKDLPKSLIDNLKDYLESNQ